MKTLTSPTLWELAVPYLASFVGSLVAEPERRCRRPCAVQDAA